MNHPTDRTLFQSAFVVDDIDAAIAKWVDELGVGPFFVADYEGVLTEVKYRGQPSELSMKVALAQAGPVQIELIQPTSSAPCAYRDGVPAGSGSAFHHMCAWTHDIEADTRYFEDRGYPCANIGYAGSAWFAYYDTRPLMGCMIEVVEKKPGVVELFGKIAQAAEGWDGSKPVRSMADL